MVNVRSTRIVKEPGKSPGDVSGAAGGSNVSRKHVSPFKDWTESDMVGQGQFGAVKAERPTVPLR